MIEFIHDATKTELENEILKLLNNIEPEHIKCTHLNRSRKYDLEFSLTKPIKYVRENNRPLILKSSNRFIIEVKSHEKNYFNVKDLRQIIDWREREKYYKYEKEIKENYYSLYKKKISPDYIYNSFEKQKLFNLIEDKCYKLLEGRLSSQSVETLHEFENDIRYILNILSILSKEDKAILIVNDNIQKVEKRRNNSTNKIAELLNVAILEWGLLINFYKRVKKGDLHIADLLVHLYNSSGIVSEYINFSFKTSEIHATNILFGENSDCIHLTNSPGFFETI